MKQVSVLGSSGSIGTQTLDVIRQNGDINVVALAVNTNIGLLFDQIVEFSPEIVCVYDENKAKELAVRLSEACIKCEVMTGMDGLIACACHPKADMVVTSFVGMIGIRPTIEAIKAGKDIALANKETLVTAGHIIMPLAKKMNVKILPVDSEHSAIFQCLRGAEGNRPEKILLTASGGPFRGKKASELKNVRPEDALKHPNWAMGKKITIDSSTMVNKGLEVMEAKWLFDVEPDDIEVVLQPQSIIHSMIEFSDGAVIAQMGVPDMKLPIQYALYFPERRGRTAKRLDFRELSGIVIDKPDDENFPALRLAYDAIKAGGSMPTVYNAVDEIAVDLFLHGAISYLDITDMIAEQMAKHTLIPNPSLDDILELEHNLKKALSGLKTR